MDEDLHPPPPTPSHSQVNPESFLSDFRGLLHFRHILFFISAAGRHTLSLAGSTGSPSAGSGRGDRLSGRGGTPHAAVPAVSGVQSSVPWSLCRRVGRGCPARPRSTRLSSDCCGSRSGHQPSIPDGPALSVRYDGPRSGSLSASTLSSCGTRQSAGPTRSGRAALRCSER